MKPKKFSSKEAIQFGWDTMKSNLGFFIVLLLIVYLLPAVIGVFIRELFGVGLSNFVEFIINAFFQMGVLKITLRFCDNEKGQLSDIYTFYPLFPKYLIAWILYGLIVLGGFILLIVPGVIWAMRFQFYGYFIIEKDCGPIEALKKSYSITRGSAWDLFLFALLIVGICILGVICLVIGLFAALPTVFVAHAFVYRKLLPQIEDSQIGDIKTPETLPITPR